mgnify:CR=1 FL=1
MSKKIRERIELNKTNKKLCGELDILCDEFKDLERKYKEIEHDLEIIKSKIKNSLGEDADYITKNFRIVVSIQPEKQEFKYDIPKILKVHPEYEENPAFGEFKTKKEIKKVASIDRL